MRIEANSLSKHFSELNPKENLLSMERPRRIMDFLAKLFLLFLVILLQIYVLVIQAYIGCLSRFCLSGIGIAVMYFLFGSADLIQIIYSYFLPFEKGRIRLTKNKIYIIVILLFNVVASLMALNELLKSLMI